MAKTDFNKAERQLDDAGISVDEANADLGRIQKRLSGLDDFQDSIEDLPEDEQAVAMVDELLKISNMLNKYDKPELDEVIKAIHENLDKDNVEDFSTLYDDYVDLANSIDLSEYEGDIEELKVLYENSKNMGGLGDEEKLERYDALFDKLKAVESLIVGRDDSEIVDDEMKRYLGMPDAIFGDKMIEYTQLKADEIKEVVDKADNYARQDAVSSLKEEGFLTPSQQQIEERYVDARKELYEDASDKMQNFKDSVYVDEDLGRRVENLSGVSEDYLDQQLEIIQLEEEQLEYSAASYPQKDATQDTMKVAPVDKAMAADQAEYNTSNSSAPPSPLKL